MRAIVEQILRERMGIGVPVRDIAELHSHASYRTYFRARLADGRSFIVMQMPRGKASASEEITNFTGVHAELPFINVARYLRGRGVPVPEVFHYDAENQVMILEDLGDELMAKRVTAAGEGERRIWYAKAVDLLVRLQRSTADSPPTECVALARSFDETLLNWEFDHFLEYGIGARLGLEMTEADRRAFDDETRAVSKQIAALPYGFTHRDFQSRNNIIRGGELFLLDFQDALLGPAVYDLVALLRDSYVVLSDETVQAMIERYAGAVGRAPEIVRAEFDLVTVQRKLKDAGRFVYIDRVKGNPGFLQFIPASLSYVRAAFGRLPDERRLLDLLTRYVPEWR